MHNPEISELGERVVYPKENLKKVKKKKLCPLLQLPLHHNLPQALPSK